MLANYGGQLRIAVFVVAEAADGYHLYGRYYDTLSGFTSAWGDYGQPPIPPYPGQRDKGFDMTNAVVWHAGNTLRINVFGTTDFEDSLSSGQEAHKGGKLIELFWDGVRSFWRWGQIQSLPVLRDWGGSIGIEPVRLRVTSTAVIDAGPWDRISVFGQDEFGAAWEYFWDGKT